MNLLLTHGYFLFDDPKELQIMKPYVPLGLLYLSSHLRQEGFAVDIYDSTFGSKQELFALIRQGPPAVLGIYANLMTRLNVLEIVRCGHEAGWTVVVGGPEPANYAEEYLRHGVDVVIAGEGELALERLLRSNGNRAAWATIGSLIFFADDGSRDSNRLIAAHQEFGCAAVARPRAHRYGPLFDDVAGFSRQIFDIPDYSSRVSLPL